jgi:ribosomal protein S18 acetylase RimI-like enzyme
MALTVRRVAVDDWREMKRVRLAALATDRMAFGSTLEAEAAFGDDVWIDRARESATSNHRALWVAVGDDGRMLGMVGAHIEEQAASLFGMWVDPAARGAGVGGKMLDALIAWLEARHPTGAISLSVNPTLAAAVRLYESRGFTPTGASTPIDHTPGARCAQMVRRSPPPSNG